eukprot:m.135715 g.135715  ORF g.135715 m.135715 type:complete len:1359 (-) comp23923_c0_seq3:125-4201(-)
MDRGQCFENTQHPARLVCDVNSISRETFVEKPEEIRCIELFFSDINSLKNVLPWFYHLRELSLTSQSLSSCEGLESCPHLETVALCETGLNAIPSIGTTAPKLRRLTMYSNNIDSLQPVAQCKNLEYLNVNNNRIQDLTPLSYLSRLKTLSIAGNNVSSWPLHGSQHPHLSEVDLAGNDFRAFSSLFRLSTFKSIEVLALDSGNFPRNPLCHISGYQAHILYLLPSLQKLDGFPVSKQSFLNQVEERIIARLTFSRMRYHTAQRLAQSIGTSILAEKQQKAQLQYKDALLQKRFQIFKVAKTSNDRLRAELEAEAQELEARLSLSDCNLSVTDISSQLFRLSSRLLTSELTSAGGVRFQQGTSRAPWFASCAKFVHSRVIHNSHTGDHAHHTSNFQVRSVFRVRNTVLAKDFDNMLERLLHPLPAESNITKGSSGFTADDITPLPVATWWAGEAVDKESSPHLQHLFYKMPTHVQTPEQTIDHLGVIIERGFTSRAEFGNLIELNQEREGSFIEHGWLLIARTCIKDCVRGSREDKLSGPAVCVVDKGFTCEVHRTQAVDPATTSLDCGCMEKHHWTITEPERILPDYVVFYTVEHISADDAVTPAATTTATPIDVAPENPTAGDSILSHDVDHLSKITTLELFNCGLSSLSFLSALPMLASLSCPFNHIDSIQECHDLPELQKLDVSFNKLSSLLPLRQLPKLAHLSAQFNAIESLDEVQGSIANLPSLHTLDLRHNTVSFEHMERLRYFLRGFVSHCQVFNNQPTHTSQASEVLEWQLSPELAKTRATWQATAPFAGFACVDTVHHCLATQSEGLNFDSSTHQLEDVTGLCLEHMQLAKLAPLQRLSKLQWLCASNNMLKKLKPVDTLLSLTQVCLANNNLQKIGALSELVRLKSLDLSWNFLKSLGGIESLSCLQELSVANNFLSSVQPCAKTLQLQQLYVHHNDIGNIREMFALRDLPRLEILDVCHNKLMQRYDARSFLIYHLRTLTLLNGEPIQYKEHTEAVQRYDGRLTLDYLAEIHGEEGLEGLSSLNLAHGGFKEVRFDAATSLNFLTTINLDYNNLLSFGGLGKLPVLRVLGLSHNRIRKLMPGKSTLDESASIFPCLEVLHLAHNGISNLDALLLHRLPQLRVLFLQHNNITSTNALHGLPQLQELILDKNKIKTLESTVLASSSPMLRELHIEANRLRDLAGVDSLLGLQRLFFGSNRICELQDLEHLVPLKNLVEVSAANNPVARANKHKQMLVYSVPSLEVVDGESITLTDRHQAEMLYGEHESDDELGSDFGLPVVNATDSRLKTVTLNFQPDLRCGALQPLPAVRSARPHPHSRGSERKNRRTNTSDGGNQGKLHIPHHLWR